MTAAAAAQLACVLEVLARKAGNVHPGAAFPDCSILDFLLSAQAISPVFGAGKGQGLGATVLAGVEATRRATAANTNLGILLLLAPLAGGRQEKLSVEACRAAASAAVAASTVADAEAVYAAIRLANPGGLGAAPAQDVKARPTVTLSEAMRLAADRDLVARQYANGFAEVFELALPPLAQAAAAGSALEEAILSAQLRTLAAVGDSLIGRKCGPAMEGEAKARAEAVLAAGWPTTPKAVLLFKELDRWLRADGHRRNPGAVADLVTAALFVALRTGVLPVPLALPWRFEALD